MVTGSIFEIRRFCIHDGPGIRTTVFFQGCPLDCWWCHNPEGRHSGAEFASSTTDSSESKLIGAPVRPSAVLAEVIKDQPFFEQSGGGVTFSGGEPMAQIEFLEELLVMARRSGLHTAVDTCGYASAEDFDRVRSLADLFLFDLKVMNPEQHIKYTGVSNEMILQNLASLGKSGARVTVRLPLIPGISDSHENFEQVAAFLAPFASLRQLSLLPYNKLGEDKAERHGLSRHRLNLEPQEQEQLETTARYFRSLGFDTHIGG